MKKLKIPTTNLILILLFLYGSVTVVLALIDICNPDFNVENSFLIKFLKFLHII